jgi:hypothetical protein
VDGRPIRTFLDSGVLIAAYKGSPSLEAPAIDILDDPNRVFLSSPFVRHEVSPKALGAMDALHIAAAYLPSADEFITSEKPSKSIYRTSLVKVLYLFR